MSSMSSLFTIGYEGRNIDEFVKILQHSRIKRVVDIREIPLSRKRGFSKTKLLERLASEGIAYAHIRELGSPKVIRHALRKDWDYDKFFRAFDHHLLQHKDAVERVYQYLNEGATCLMCFERHPEKCHRSLVVRQIKIRDGNGLPVHNL
jgi:uncharacterized protein (DUF488 family)